MVREEVYKLQARVDVLEQVRLGWEWVLLVSPVPRAVVPNHGGLGVLWGKGRKDAGFLTVLGSTVRDSLVWEELRSGAHLDCYTRTLVSLKPQTPRLS